MSAGNEDELTDDISSTLFEAARVDGPRALAKRRAARALGITMPPAVPTRQVAAESKRARGYARSKAADNWLSTAAKAAALALVAGAGWLSASHALREDQAENQLTAEEIPPGPPARAAAPPAVTRATNGAEAPQPRKNTASNESRRPPKTGARVPPESSPGATLSEEVAALDRVQERVNAQDAASALSLLDAYRARFPRGRLEAEATVLRVQALDLANRRDAAASVGREFMSKHPNSPLSDRVRDLVDEKSAAQEQSDAGKGDH